MMPGKKLAIYDPKVEGAALALIEKAAKDLGRVTTIREASDVRTFAKIARERALSIPTFNQAAALILAAEIAIGQMLLKSRAPAQGGRPKKTGIVTIPVNLMPTLQETLGKQSPSAAKQFAARLRSFAASVSVEQLHRAVRILTEHKEAITRKAVQTVVSSAWKSKEEEREEKAREEEAKRKRSTDSKVFTDAEWFTSLRAAAKAALTAAMELHDRGFDVSELLPVVRKAWSIVEQQKAFEKKEA